MGKLSFSALVTAHLGVRPFDQDGPVPAIDPKRRNEFYSGTSPHSVYTRSQPGSESNWQQGTNVNTKGLFRQCPPRAPTSLPRTRSPSPRTPTNTTTVPVRRSSGVPQASRGVLAVPGGSHHCEDYRNPSRVMFGDVGHFELAGQVSDELSLHVFSVRCHQHAVEIASQPGVDARLERRPVDGMAPPGRARSRDDDPEQVADHSAYTVGSSQVAVHLPQARDRGVHCNVMPRLASASSTDFGTVQQGIDALMLFVALLERSPWDFGRAV